MKTAIRAHFDGKVFVREEPVDLPKGEKVIIQVLAPSHPLQMAETPEQFEQLLDELRTTTVTGVNIPDEALRREHLYHEEAVDASSCGHQRFGTLARAG